jgi:acetoacetate decarboxylase
MANKTPASDTLKGFTSPRTPKGTSGIVAPPPWHYVGQVTAIEFEADGDKIAPYLPAPKQMESHQCCVYFIEWQYTSETTEDYLDPVESQYRETILLMSGSYKGEAMAYCPFIWVDQDKALMRGLIQGWPKQLGSTHMSRSYALESKAAPTGLSAATLSVNGKRYMAGRVQVYEADANMPAPSFAGSALVRYFPDLVKGNHQQPLVHELVQLKSRDVQISKVAKGEAMLDFTVMADHELSDFSPKKVLAGYRFQVALTVDDLKPLTKL